MTLRTTRAAFVGALLLVLSLAATAQLQRSDQPRNDLPQTYRTARDWGQLPAGMKWAAVTAIEPAPDGSIYVIHRCFANSCAGRSEPPILKFDPSGKLLASWGSWMFIFPHGATVDSEGFVWIAHWGGWRIVRYDSAGRAARTIMLPV